jgi:hypothetical protein
MCASRNASEAYWDATDVSKDWDDMAEAGFVMETLGVKLNRMEFRNGKATYNLGKVNFIGTFKTIAGWTTPCLVACSSALCKQE